MTIAVNDAIMAKEKHRIDLMYTLQSCIRLFVQNMLIRLEIQSRQELSFDSMVEDSPDVDEP